MPYDEPEFETTEASNAYWMERVEACQGWRDARRALTKIVLETNGRDPYGHAPANIAAASVFLEDVVVVVGDDPDYEGAHRKPHRAVLGRQNSRYGHEARRDPHVAGWRG